MLPPLSALRAPLYSAPASATCRWIIAAFVGLHVATAGSIAADLPVLGNVPGDQDNASIVIGSSGGYIAWEDNRVQTGREGKGIAAAAVAAGLREVGEPFKVSSQKDGRQERPQVVALHGGGHLFLWEVRNGKAAGLYARMLGTNGAFNGNDVLVSVPTTKLTHKVSTNWTAPYRGVLKPRKHKFKELVTNTREQSGAASVVALPDGGALVAYHAMRRSDTNSWRLEGRTLLSRGQFIQDSVLRPYRVAADWMSDVFLRRFDSQGRMIGEEVQVNQTAEYNQRTPVVGWLQNGSMIVVWVSELERPAQSAIHPDGRTRPPANFSVSLVGRFLDANGQPVGDEFILAASEQAAHANPVLQPLTDGGFMVGWSQQDGAGRGWDVYARNFAADGSATGPAFRMNSYTTGEQYAPKFAGAGDRLIAVWTSVGQDGSREGIYGRRLYGGALFGGEFRINDFTISRQWHPVVTSDGAGAVVVVWSGFTGTDGFDLFSAQYFLGETQ